MACVMVTNKPNKNIDDSQPFRWGPTSHQAAVLLASGEYTIRAAAEKLNISERRLETWHSHAEFKKRVEEDRAKRFAEIRQTGLAHR